MVNVDVVRPDELSAGEWKQLQVVHKDALAGSIGEEKAEALTDWNRPFNYLLSHLDPNKEVGSFFNANQAYYAPAVALARNNDKFIGFAYSAHNVSGGGSPEGPHNDSAKARLIRDLKRISVIKNYLWVREIAVSQDYQRQGVAKSLGRALLENAILFQPVSTYVLASEMPFMRGLLEHYGFEATGQMPTKIFGEKGETTTLLRMQARSVRGVLKKLN